jgi:hypothetical protein
MLPLPIVAVAPYPSVPIWLVRVIRGWAGIAPGVPRRCRFAAYCSLILRVGIALLTALWLAGR